MYTYYENKNGNTSLHYFPKEELKHYINKGYTDEFWGSINYWYILDENNNIVQKGVNKIID